MSSPAAEQAWDVVRSALLEHDGLVRAVVSGRQRNHTVPYRRVELRYVELRDGVRLQVVSLDQTQAHTRNVHLGEPAERVVDELLTTGYANVHVWSTTGTLELRVTKKGRAMLRRSPVDAAPDAELVATSAPPGADRSHDRRKRRRLEESDELFRVLGITDGNGRVKPTRTAKFRQVQDFLAALEPMVDDAVTLGPGDGLSSARPLQMVDLGCGNAYLTLAAFRYLSEVKGLPVAAVGVDVKAQARAHNTEVARELGISDQVVFVDGEIGSVALDESPDLVLALHACDTATDDALARAVRWQAPVLLAAPCCHHDIQRQLRERGEHALPAAYRLVTRHGILRERWADVLTDALRAAVLRIAGYRVEVIEFVDSAHTPRNAMIRAVRTGGPPDEELVRAYRELTAEWGVTPALASRLADHPPLRGALSAS